MKIIGRYRMKSKRRQIIVDKKFQIGISFKAIVLPLITTLFISSVALYYAVMNNRLTAESTMHIDEVISTQDSISSLILENIKYSDSPEAIKKIKPFSENINHLKRVKEKSGTIVKNSEIVFYFLITMTVVQTAIIFIMFIFFTHKISGPIYVMTRCCREIKEGKTPIFRPLRKKDEFKDFYEEMQSTVEYLISKQKK
jgi:nitrogen fixation/metabolism regulation signal transduction histidine kinase